MRDDDLDQIQMDLDMQLLTQMQIERHLEELGGRDPFPPIQPERETGGLGKLFRLVVVILALYLLYKLGMLLGGL